MNDEDDKLVCPRRIETPPHFLERLGPHDKWVDRGTYGECCSFCGSMSPASLFELMTVYGVELGPTDKDYKVYIKPDVSGVRDGKFYFQHFSEEDMHQFIDILNARNPKTRIGYPGHFYVMPFFMAKGVKNDSSE